MMSWRLIVVLSERRNLMERFSGFVTGALLAMLVTAPVYAQQPAAVTPAPTGGDMQMMDMCRQMMSGGMMATPMMGAPASADPKERAEMLQMRGEMMKAMGDVMMRHARQMQGTMGK
jgi:hypothetical protein